jgi:Adenosine-deaminase (editase) domain
MSKETFNEELGHDEWPIAVHDSPHGSGIKLGEFALLLKKDNNRAVAEEKPKDTADTSTDTALFNVTKGIIPKGKIWPANESDDWTPPGTTIVRFRGQKGSIHTCSDKICRWNFLGIQGSLLASFLQEPLYVSTVTVGRKLSGAVCRRALCCRLDARSKKPIAETIQESVSNKTVADAYHVNHPAIMGTAVYMDDTGVVETNSDAHGQDVRFHSPLTWAWWPNIGEAANSNQGILECLDGSTGLMFSKDGESSETGGVSRISTQTLTNDFHRAFQAAAAPTSESSLSEKPSFRTLKELRNFKMQHSRSHEEVKEALLSKHKVLSSWNRRWTTSESS